MFWNRARNQVLSFLLKIQQLTTSHFFIFLWIKLTSFLFFGICVSVPNKNDDSQNPVKKKHGFFKRKIEEKILKTSTLLD